MPVIRMVPGRFRAAGVESGPVGAVGRASRVRGARPRTAQGPSGDSGSPRRTLPSAAPDPYTKEIVMKKLQRVAVVAALTAATAVGLVGVGATANATTAAPAHRTQAAASSRGGAGSVRTNEHVVEAFLQDVVNEHNGGAAANFLTPDMQWYGGT